MGALAAGSKACRGASARPDGAWWWAVRPAAVANQLAVSASTLRELSTLYADWLSPVAARGRDRPGAHRRYTPEDIKILSEIGSLVQAGYPREKVRAMLRAPAERAGFAVAQLPARDGRDDEIARLKRELEAERDLVKHVYGRVAPLEQRLEEARAKIEKLQRALAQAELANTLLQRENGALRFELDEIARERQRPLWKRVLS
jgi:DNA-binding transcriptional MerR regulator